MGTEIEIAVSGSGIKRRTANRVSHLVPSEAFHQQKVAASVMFQKYL